MLCEHFPICKLTDLQDASNLKKNLRIISQQRCCWLREEVVVAKEGQDGDDDGDDDYSPSEGDINGLGDKSERQEEEETVPTRTKKKAANAVPKTKPSKAASKAKKPRKPPAQVEGARAHATACEKLEAGRKASKKKRKSLRASAEEVIYVVSDNT
ncbi:hypothetical protein PC110_g20553 [Phytophthora cactorum]|uniref:Uncharacterized protein n=1 Tax=Phytophthora cactorum TaxID=29920 RepID=A0A329RF70_9STRA|nr:hypothetical protein PC112_g19401 [Phytophthora cactorum]KAG2878048.1 hypothetical protein PC114_g23315 [Phytophthora cactorum]KAG3025845.1 hypothetical protein PC120_g6215 [Phytophthora cactorum]KAG3093452.1 hypothetical protein PC122_g6171 [Phytophthora cactorum]KAG4042150.1 hypothetical protein PC123_g22349 [Phytophthora cactorum]